MFVLAEVLGKTVAEIEQMTIEEWHYWSAYFKIKEQKLQHRLQGIKR